MNENPDFFETKVQQVYSKASVVEIKSILAVMSPQDQEEIYKFLYMLGCRIF
jgi:hypothetical protein